jgi:hypothetical protein
MHASVGFSLSSCLGPERVAAALAAQRRALSRRPNLERVSRRVGLSNLDLWGRGDQNECIHELPDGSILAVVGSPQFGVDWLQVDKTLLGCERVDTFGVPWDGRVILLRISSDGREWTMWNDWVGSIPVFHAEVGGGRIASTLEPVVVEAGGFSLDDVFLPGLVSLMLNGHFLADWTLFKGMKITPPDSVTVWNGSGVRSTQLWTVRPTVDRWETRWDDLVDEMHELVHRAIAGVLRTQESWLLPLSSGLDSRLVAAVGAEVGASMHAFSWGEPGSTDVVYARQIAKLLGISWKRIDLPRDFLRTYTPHWADWFGSGMHFHGMYQMCFLDAVEEFSSPNWRVVSGFLGEVLAGDAVEDLLPVHGKSRSYHLQDEWRVHWSPGELQRVLRFDIADALEANAEELGRQFRSLPGASFQKLQFMESWGRQRLFGSFQTTVADCWRGVATPFMNRAYARFSMSLPLVALGNRRLLGDMFRRHYGRLSTVPGTYGSEPHRLTGRYLLKRRIAGFMPAWLRRFVPGLDEVPLRLDVGSVQALGKEAVWPIFERVDQLGDWLDLHQLETNLQTIMRSKEDVRPLRKLQSVQALAYRLPRGCAWPEAAKHGPSPSNIEWIAGAEAS